VLTSSLGLIAWQGSNNLDKVVSLVGCFACIPLSFIYPALFHSHITTNKWIKLKDWAIVVFGVVATVYTTWITIQQWATSSGGKIIDRCEGV
jgi:proton-coupled amino acid transporter